MNLHMDVPTDGRAARAYRTKLAVVDALLDLLRSGIERPSAPEIAKRAGVSLRLVFHHFDDLEELYSTAADLQQARVGTMISPIDPEQSFEKRLAAFCRQRARIFEFVTPVRRAALRLESSSSELSRRLHAGHKMARELTLKIFHEELSTMPLGEADEVSWSLDAVASWEMWDFLRHRSQLTERQAIRVIERMIRSLLIGND